jgi:trehalose 6-phosphate phosphatase
MAGPGDRSSPDEVASALAPLRSDPPGAAILSDLDGTLAPIVERAEDAAIPVPTRELLAELAGRYGHVGIVSGRDALDARRIVGLDELVYVGNHGLEMLPPGASAPRPVPALSGHGRDAASFLERSVDADGLAAGGVRVEDKGPIVALHWRAAADEARAEQLAVAIARRAASWGLARHRGRKVIELRPDVAVDKGTAIAELLERLGARSALYGGDDRTDADAFAALARMRAAGDLRAAVCVAALAPESPPEVERGADLVVAGTEGFAALLGGLL